MSIGGFKAAKLRATTNKSSQSGVITAYAANAKDTLTRVKDIILGFGNWTWNNDLGFISSDGTETSQYITYYTTLTHDNGAKLWLGYGASGVQLHWSCFAQFKSGSSSSYPTITENGTTYTLLAEQSGGWLSGLLMSMIPAGSPNNYSTPNKTDNTWMPFDATPILGYLGTDEAAYKNAATVSTAARMISDEYIYILAKDDLFMVMCHDPTWGGFTSNAGMGTPCYLGYVVGNLFEGLNPDDSAYYSKYGWWGGRTAIRISNGSPYTWGWSAPFAPNASRLNPDSIYNNSINSAAEYGTFGFFRKDGSKFAQSGPNGFPYIMPCCEEQSGIAARMYQGPQNARWYAIEVGVLSVTEATSQTNIPVAHKTQIKGIIRTDFMRGYVPVDPRYETRFRVPPYGTKFDDANFIMGPCNTAIGWDSTITESDTEILCPWRGQAAFQYYSYVSCGGFQDIIQSIAASASKIFISYTDYANHSVCIDSASLGSTTFDGVETISQSADSLHKLMYNSSNSTLYLANVTNDQYAQVYSVNQSTRVPTLLNTPWTPTNPLPYLNTDRNTLTAYCNDKYNHIIIAWTNNIPMVTRHTSIYIYDASNNVDLLQSDTDDATFPSLVQDACIDIEGNIYVLSSFGGGTASTYDTNIAIQKLCYDSSNSTYKFMSEDGTLSTDNTTLWKNILVNGQAQAIVADKYGYIYVFYRTSGESDVEQIGSFDMGVKKIKADGTICWTKHLGISGNTAMLFNIRAIYTFDNKIHFSGQTDEAFPTFTQSGDLDVFFGTMTTDGVFSVKYQGNISSTAIINAMTCVSGYDYLGINDSDNVTSTKPIYALMKRTW